MNTATPNRTATPHRWNAALARAYAANVTASKLNDTTIVVSSATRPGLKYRTDGVSCECEAAINGDPICLHRAVYWSWKGVLEYDPNLTTA